MNRPLLNSKRRRFDMIPGFSDQPGLPRLAKIRLGVKTTGPKGSYPTEVSYFVFDAEDTLPGDLRADLTERFIDRYGDQPQTIDNAIFISAERHEAFSQSLEWWGSGKMLCHGNGDEAERMNRQTGEWEEMPHCANSGECAEWQSGKACKMISRLRFILPDVTMAGYFQLDTGSKYSSANIRDGINLLYALFGRIHGIPLTLTRAPRKIEYQGKANVHYIVNLFAPNVAREEAMKLAGASKLLLTESEEPGDPVGIPATDLLRIPDNDLPEDLIPQEEQSVIPEPEEVDEQGPFDGIDTEDEAHVTQPIGLRVTGYKVAKEAKGWTLYTFSTSDGAEHVTFSTTVYEAAKKAHAAKAAITMESEPDSQGREQVVLLEVIG